MKSKNYFPSFILISLQIFISSCSSRPEPTFTNTQHWVPEWKEAGTKRAGDAAANPLIEVPPPPKSAKKEIELLLNFQNHARSPEVINQILLDRELSGWTMGEIVFNDHLNSGSPLGSSLMRLFHDTFPDILAVKLKYDRIRAFNLDRRITSIIECPGHASYPSGHSSSAFFYAHFLSDILPEERSKLFCDAARIAVEREIAGVHYPSDSEAGRAWAEAFYGRWKAIPQNAKELDRLRKWWMDNRTNFLKARAHRKPEIIGPEVCDLNQAREFFLSRQGSSTKSLKTK